MTNRFPAQRHPHRRTRLIDGHARCTWCGLPASLQFGLAAGRPCSCVGCVGKVVRLWKEDTMSHSPQSTGKQEASRREESGKMSTHERKSGTLTRNVRQHDLLPHVKGRPHRAEQVEQVRAWLACFRRSAFYPATEAGWWCQPRQCTLANLL